MKEKTKRKQMSLLDPIVDLILGYSDIDFEKIIQEERQKAAGRRCRTPPDDRPEPAEGSPHPGQPPPRDSYRITTRQPPAPEGPARTGPAGADWERGSGGERGEASRLPSKATWP